MSIGPFGGLAASAAGAPIAQSKGSEVDHVQQGSSAQQRKIQTDQKAEIAAGIGQADGEDHQTGQRDADGRRLWEKTSGPTAANRLGPGVAGGQLDRRGQPDRQGPDRSKRQPARSDRLRGFESGKRKAEN